MAKRLKFTHRIWSDDDLKLLKELYPIRKTKEVAEILGRSQPSVAFKAQVVGLKKVGTRKWSFDEIQLLKELFPIKKTKEVVERIGRSMDSVTCKAYIMDIKKK